MDQRGTQIEQGIERMVHHRLFEGHSNDSPGI